MRGTTSVKEIRTAIRELSVRADVARRAWGGMPQKGPAAEIERRVEGYRNELGHRP